jgi:uncharacterized membrane protein
MAQDDLPKHIACALCYSVFALTGLLFLTMTPYSRNREIRVHALQSIFLTTVFLLLWFSLSIVSFAVPTFLNLLVGMVMVLFWLGFLGCWGASMVKAYNRQRLELPVISELAQKFA